MKSDGIDGSVILSYFGFLAALKTQVLSLGIGYFLKYPLYSSDGWIPPKYVSETRSNSGCINSILNSNEKDTWSSDCNNNNNSSSSNNSSSNNATSSVRLRLYDLELDPTEREDISRRRPEDVQRLLRRLEELVRRKVSKHQSFQKLQFSV